MKQKMKKITNQQYIELDKWLLGNIGSCKDKHHAAELASVALGVEVSPSSITQVCTHRGLTLPRKVTKREARSTQEEMLVIQADMDELRAAVAVLSRFFNGTKGDLHA